MNQEDFMRRAIRLSVENVRAGRGGPFGAVIVKDGDIVAEGTNRVTSQNDPTAHAEVMAIREACRKLGDFALRGCEIYTSCEPCPMCLCAIRWARIDRIYFANSRHDAARIGFDDADMYEDLNGLPEERTVPSTSLLADEARIAFDEWETMQDKTRY